MEWMRKVSGASNVSWLCYFVNVLWKARIGFKMHKTKNLRKGFVIAVYCWKCVRYTNCKSIALALRQFPRIWQNVVTSHSYLLRNSTEFHKFTQSIPSEFSMECPFFFLGTFYVLSNFQIIRHETWNGCHIRHAKMLLVRAQSFPI